MAYTFLLVLCLVATKFKTGYLTLLANLYFRKITLLLDGVFLLATAEILPQLSTGFVPKDDSGMIPFYVTLRQAARWHELMKSCKN